MPQSTDKIEIEFTKIEGAGNDFVLIDNRAGLYKFPLTEFAQAVCHRHNGIGADGLIVLENSKKADFKMRYINSDGSEGGMCGNGGRCVAHFGLLGNQTKNSLQFEALDNIYKAERAGQNIRLWMKNPIDLKRNIKIFYQDYELTTDYINTGAPHTVFFLTDLPGSLYNKLDSMEILPIGKYVRYHPSYAPEGTNVNFIETSLNRKISIRTYERGVEDETLACGTGSVASAILSALKFDWQSPVEVFTRSKSKLLVYFKRESNVITDVILEGPARVVFTGKFNYSLPLKRIV
ncbi:MAG: diaminopimelate epimerase [Bacteroidetes bacterium]|nr:diaminopimelate epimerase [Bacteroidota bacterium]MBU1422324.1 diaminopimelate epimerase [Bacteroidota bacterium]MBU2636252.1 diaminopimelate epimerase [Bacteroidota bacterium]